MKRITILGAATFLFAIGSAFVSKGTLNGKFNDLYRQTTTSPTQCIVSVCNLLDTKPCTFQSYITQGTTICTNPVASFKD